MRCLFCGKELALLKRWTGGGEFCSDAHRQRYQEEYNQLALNRLLQAKPPVDAPPAEPAKPAAALKPSVPAEPAKETLVKNAPKLPAAPPPAKPAYRETSSPAAVRAETAVAVEVSAAKVADNERAPVEMEAPAPAGAAGFLMERPAPVLAVAQVSSVPDMEFFQGAAAELPNHAFGPLNGRQDTFQLETAGPVTFQPSEQAWNYTANGSRERRLEVRDFVRTAPIVEFQLRPSGETGLETSSEAMDILFFPQPPGTPAALWQEPPVGFSAGGTELGDLARLSFETTGFSDRAESDRQPTLVTGSQNGAAVAVEEPPAIEIPFAREPEPEAPVEAATELAPEFDQVAEPLAGELVEQTMEQVEPPAERVPDIPEAATRPLPLMLQGVGPGKAKTVQVYSSASSSIAVQVPRSTSLPLRPVMTLGPAPVAAKSEPRKPSVAPAPVRPVNPKLRQPDVKADVKADAKANAKAGVKPALKTPPAAKELKPKEEVKPSKEAEPFVPPPLGAPYPGSSDLGLPRLNFQTSPGFWGRLPVVAKIAIVVVLLAGLGGVIAYSSKSGGAAVTRANGGTLVTGSPLPAGDAGWITDWGADPGVRRTRQISILGSSQTLTDYRIEMQGQIETKAIGWVFRAADPRNFYVTKLEIVKPGLEPTVALVRFAVVNGEEQAHAQIPLPMKVRRDTMYKIRFDAVGDRFTTYVQDEKVDEWTDDQVKTGGVGLYSERGEVATLKGGMSVLPLVVKR
ncbi:MAG: hypothetical protein ABSF12_03800 [Bryobacteraceae bacterium]